MRTPGPREADQSAQGHEAEPSLSDSRVHLTTWHFSSCRGFCPVLVSARGEVGYGKTPKTEREALFQFCHFPSERPWAGHFPFLSMFPHWSGRDEGPCPPTAEKGHADKGGYRAEKHFEIRKLKLRTGRACYRCLQYVYQNTCMHMHHNGTTLGHIQPYVSTVVNNYSLASKAVSSKSQALTFAQGFLGILNEVETNGRKEGKEREKWTGCGRHKTPRECEAESVIPLF